MSDQTTKENTMASTETAPPISPLVAGLITASAAQTQATTNYLIDTLTAQLAERDAELAAIREGVLTLFDGPYMPTPAGGPAGAVPDRRADQRVPGGEGDRAAPEVRRSPRRAALRGGTLR